MQHKKTALVLALLASTVVTGTAQASLEARTGDMVYDTFNNITWASNANLFKTQATGNANLVTEIINANGGAIHDTANNYDTPANSGSHTLTEDDFNTSNGQMTWFGAQAWANNLTLGDFTDWSLPTTIPALSGNNQTGSQMGDLFYTQLGVSAGSDIATSTNPNYGLFTNVQSYGYWSGSEVALNPDTAWGFFTVNGDQYTTSKNSQVYAWAVRSGDVAAVPLPGAAWLFLTGMIGVMGLKHRKNIA